MVVTLTIRGSIRQEIQGNFSHNILDLVLLPYLNKLSVQGIFMLPAKLRQQVV